MSHWIIEERARQELKMILNQPDLTISLNGKIASKIIAGTIAKELMTIGNMQAHHSHPTDRLKIEIKSKLRTETLSIAKDSEIENEYWIYWDKYKVTNKNEIGRIRTDIFKGNGGL